MIIDLLKAAIVGLILFLLLGPLFVRALDQAMDEAGVPQLGPGPAAPGGVSPPPALPGAE